LDAPHLDAIGHGWRDWIQLIAMIVVFCVTTFICESIVFRVFDIHYIGPIEPGDDGRFYSCFDDFAGGLFSFMPFVVMFIACAPGRFLVDVVEAFFDNLWIPNKQWP
jgi:hypothetical protein